MKLDVIKINFKWKKV